MSVRYFICTSHGTFRGPVFYHDEGLMLVAVQAVQKRGVSLKAVSTKLQSKTEGISQPPPDLSMSSSCLVLTRLSGQKESSSTKITHLFYPKLCWSGNGKVTSQVWPPRSSQPEPVRKALTSPRHEMSPTRASTPASPNLPVNLTHQRGRRSLPHVSAEGIYPPQALTNRLPSPPPTAHITFHAGAKTDSVCICPIHQPAARTPTKHHHHHHRLYPRVSCPTPNSQPKPRPRKAAQ